jgi:hypothetical protein
MSDEQITENQRPNGELSNEDLEKVQGGVVDAYLYFERDPPRPRLRPSLRSDFCGCIKTRNGSGVQARLLPQAFPHAAEIIYRFSQEAPFRPPQFSRCFR